MVSTVSSQNTHTDEATGVQSLENDSVIITYIFSGENSPLQIDVYNKLNEPIYVNWAHSALIIGDKAYSFVNEDMKIEATTFNSPAFPYVLNGNYTEGTISGDIKVSTREGFIPSKSRIGRKLYILNNVQIPEIDKSLYKVERYSYNDDEGSVYGRKAIFNEQNSPLKFRSYITLFTLKDNIPHLFSYQNNFYISSVIKLGSNPKTLIDFDTTQANMIIHSKSTAYGKTMTVVALGTAIGALDYANDVANKNNRHK